MVVAQLVEQTLPTPEICSSNPDIDKILSTNCTIEKTKIKKKRLEWPILKKTICYCFHVIPQLYMVSPLYTLHLKNSSSYWRFVWRWWRNELRAYWSKIVWCQRTLIELLSWAAWRDIRLKTAQYGAKLNVVITTLTSKSTEPLCCTGKGLDPGS